MELPSSVAALLVAIFAVLPGMPGEKMYRLLVGSDWREDKWQRTLRLLAFSVAGLALYAALGPILGAPTPSYISSVNLQSVDTEQVRSLGAALLGHMAAATGMGILAGFVARLGARFVSRSAYSSAWDHFVNRCVRNHWVVVGLENGEVYVGYLDVADLSVTAPERDIILREPALYDQASQRYRATPYQTLFLPGTIVSSVGVVSDAAVDKRITTPGELLFNERENEHGE